MSTKFDKYITDLSTEIVDKYSGELTTVKFFNPVLDKNGSEVVSEKTLVQAADLRHMSLGERIRRYERTPQFLQNLQDNLGYDEDLDIDTLPDPDAPPPTVQEAEEIKSRLLELSNNRIAREKEAEIDRQYKQFSAFSQRQSQLKKDASEPPLPLEGGGVGSPK